MTKRIATTILLLMVFCLSAAVAVAADGTTKGKVLSVTEGSVQIAIDGDKPTWVKKNAPVKFPEGTGKIIEITAEGVTPVVITVKTKKAAAMKAGEAVSFEKGKAMSGC